MQVRKLWCIRLLLLLLVLPVACVKSFAKVASRDVVVPSGVADPFPEPSQVMQSDVPSLPSAAGLDEQLIAAQLSAKSRTAARRRRRRRRQASRRRRSSSRRRSTSRRRRRGTPTTSQPRPSPTPAPSPVPSPTPTLPPAPAPTPCNCQANTFYGARSVPIPPEGECLCEEMCYMFGDPHFITFDGLGSPFFADASLNRFWAVRSANVEIQGIATGEGSWIQGVAVRVGSHILTAYRGDWTQFRVTWDNQVILTSEGANFEAEGVQLHRAAGFTYLPSEDELKKIFGIAEAEKNFYQLEHVLNGWRTSRNVYTFKLPESVEIFMTVSKLPGQTAAEVVIKMPPQPGQGGWCGNFNGNKDDDTSASDREGIDVSADLFQMANISFIEHKSRSGAEVQQNSTAPPPCNGSVLEIAKLACDHLKDEELHDDCVVDICTTKRVNTAMDAADDILIMRGMEGRNKKCKCKKN